MSMILYRIFCSIRIVLVLFPQTGYIHPDEHFQGPEIVYGDILDLKVHPTWEFTSEKPIRNIVFPYFVTGFPSLLADFIGIKSLQGTFLYPYLILVMPRIIMCCLSFLNDIFIFKMCFMMKKNHKTYLLMFSSSYVTLVYLPRTFSNCLEVLFFSCTIYLLCKFLYIRKALSNKESNIPIENCTNSSFMLGLVIAMGFFNRPTFVCFAIYPVSVFLFLLLKMEQKLTIRLKHFAVFSLGSFSILLSYTAIDSLYYNKIHYSTIYDLYSNIISTPLNFILYNTNKNHLDSHGLHSHWLHMCVNIPLLFSIYGILVMLVFIRYLSKLLSQSYLHFEMFLMLSFITPLFLLSVIPHQEARFLLPLIIPLTLLHDDSFCYKFISKSNCVKFWYINNIVGVLFFGFLHQGGVFISTSYLHSSIQNNHNSTIIFYKTYMPPRYLLGLPKRRTDVNVFDFAGTDISTLDLLFKNSTHQYKPLSVYVITPHEVANEILDLNIFQSNYKLLRRKYLFPNLSTENLPKLSHVMDVLNNNMSLLYKVNEMKKIFSIHILFFKPR